LSIPRPAPFYRSGMNEKCSLGCNLIAFEFIVDIYAKICCKILKKVLRFELEGVKKYVYKRCCVRAKTEALTKAKTAQPHMKRPPLFRVALLNDDFTPMEFVVEVLQLFFNMNREKATRVMLEVHTRGKGICGVYTFDVAETKVTQVMGYARQYQHPLLCQMEEA